MSNSSASVRTTDLSLAAFLQLAGYQIQSIEEQSPRSMAFIFAENAAIRTTIQDFWSGKQLVDPVAYFQSLRLLKSRIRQSQ